MAIASINPATGELTKRFDAHTDSEIESALGRAVSAFEKYRASSFAERAVKLRHAAEMPEKDREHLARIITGDMGKLLRGSIDEIEKCARGCRFYAEHGEKFLSEQIVSSDARRSYVRYDPLGVVLAIMPWNFPYWQVFRFAAPALMAGNTTVPNHASNVSRVALEIERIFQEAGLPQGVLRTVLVPGSETGRLIEDSRIAAVTLTGSEAAGVEVAATSGHVLKKTVLELGGSDPFIVLEDADLDEAAQVAVTARFQNNGQSCIAAKRFIVVNSVAEAFEQKFVANTAKLKVGDPLEYDTRIGPLARKDLQETLDQQVQQSIQQGAKVLIGGKAREGKGNFYEPTILTNVTPQMSVFTDETFGPVAAVIRARDTEHALELANDSKFGLSSNLWTRNIEQARELTARIEAGGVFINGMTASDPRLPFGGVKRSGYGRELSSFGIREFVNVQSA